ncbi:MAG TPA: methyltransferase [Stellaceae bacterium]|nr:methyltransferase [Stellaceae bacterium]
MQPTDDQDAILQVLYANFGCFALLTAHNLQIFKLFESESLTASEAATRLGIAHRPMEILLTTLAAHRFLMKTGDRFAAGSLARNYLLESSPTYIGGMLDFAVATHSMCTVDNLEACIRSDRSLAYGRGEMFQEHAEQAARARVFTEAMHGQSIAPAMAWPGKLDLSGCRMMLDIAGGSGAHAIGALQKWPQLEATVYEMTPVSGFVSEYAQRYKLSDRLTSVTGDMWKDPFAPADLHFYSQVFHDWTPEQCRFLAEKSYATLPSGGRLIVHELLLDPDKAGPLVPSLMSMVMLLWTEGRQYSVLELTQMLESAGFTDVRTERTFGAWGIATGLKP